MFINNIIMGANQVRLDHGLSPPSSQPLVDARSRDGNVPNRESVGILLPGCTYFWWAGEPELGAGQAAQGDSTCQHTQRPRLGSAPAELNHRVHEHHSQMECMLGQVRLQAQSVLAKIRVGAGLVGDTEGSIQLGCCIAGLHRLSCGGLGSDNHRCLLHHSHVLDKMLRWSWRTWRPAYHRRRWLSHQRMETRTG